MLEVASKLALLVVTAGAIIVFALSLFYRHPRWPTPLERWYCGHPECRASFLGPSAQAQHELAAHAQPLAPSAIRLPPRNLDIVHRGKSRFLVRTADGAHLRVVEGKSR